MSRCASSNKSTTRPCSKLIIPLDFVFNLYLNLLFIISASTIVPSTVFIPLNLDPLLELIADSTKLFISETLLSASKKSFCPSDKFALLPASVFPTDLFKSPDAINVALLSTEIVLDLP